ncbi:MULTISPECIES: zinc-dependent alcohol dehydrogenase [Aeromonas]|uniref:zinc-dependent alcohol dehydrogenase n=1 Tax=Aeromonas TaxID=642 RepID=UPI0003709C2F|nr:MULTISPECIES: alcohol dehydrogenase catalytic domain-containing protein [Aeromonas]MBS4715404.1 alcohol dehydrogenase catalytic domain-containing protein [Aeromonas dhakensis]QXA14185.1 alcohol dehydrogenase catalytic domain-containing protein [Aeromonas sp. FDAARGOS 1403]HDZ8877016.1 alcohol dehydrogenase catalytic domain-containing protein [Aeromonas dhakensis]
MQALKYVKRWQVEVVESADLACIEADDVVVDIAVCGICGTDVGIISGAYPVAVPGTTLGHETSGVVRRIGRGVTRFQVGDRVVVNPTYACGECRMCQTGNPNHCEQKMGTEAGVSYDGAFAHQYRAREGFLRKLDDHVSMEAASLTEPLSCTITGVDKLAITHTNIRAAVVGAGPMGMLYLWVLHHKGLKPFLVENNPGRSEFVRAHLPPSTSIYEDFEQALEQEYGSKQSNIDLCVDTTGQLTELVFSRLAPGGKLLNVALKEKLARLDVLRIADKSLSVIGSIDSLNNSFERAYAMIRDGAVPVAGLISHVFDFSDYQQAFKTVGCDIANQAMVPLVTPNCKVLVRLADIH